MVSKYIHVNEPYFTWTNVLLLGQDIELLRPDIIIYNITFITIYEYIPESQQTASNNGTS